MGLAADPNTSELHSELAELLCRADPALRADGSDTGFPKEHALYPPAEIR